MVLSFAEKNILGPSVVRGVAQCRHFADKGRGGSSDANVRNFWHKNFGFFEIYVSARTRMEGS